MQPPTDLAAAISAASSPDWRARAQAGQDLARHADRDDVADRLLALLLDAQDTAVTDATAGAVLQRGDVTGVRLLARAVAAADDEHLDHLSAAIAEHVHTVAQPIVFQQSLTALAKDPDPTVRTGAQSLAEWINPPTSLPEQPD
ncbi:hypothetical protein AB0J80_17830 [Actinoplanes sp. NPDC049548]|uniref:hypothetical protein n=1 Tax=Actinoplanes sp. NPDC049548 TaxID=3155152 RepID=UPI00343DF64F